MDTFVIVKRPGQRSELVPAPERVNLEFLRPLIGGYIEVFPVRGQISDILTGLTIFMDEEGQLKKLAPNLTFPFAAVVGPVVVVQTDEEGDDHGFEEGKAKSIAQALDHYAVGLRVGVN